MIFRQLFDQSSYTYTYLLASREGGEALIIDPVLEKVDRYLALFEDLGVKLVKAIDTHVHADHITGLGALRDRTHCITVMGAQSQVDVVSMRVDDGDTIDVDGIQLTALYTPGHTSDSYSFLMDDRVFTGDTLFIRGTGRTDFQNGSAKDQYNSLFNKLLKLPEDTLVYPGHDYKGDTVSTIGEEIRHNPRLQVSSEAEYVELMSHLKLADPKMMDVAVPANLKIGLSQDELEKRGWAFTPEDAAEVSSTSSFVFADLRDDKERQKHGVIEFSVHAPYGDLQENVAPNGMLRTLVEARGAKLVFYCAFGERSAMAVQAARDAGLDAWHVTGGINAWEEKGLPLVSPS
ncbi:MAG: MBL fold metallo-hydrolase [Alphaproteobacteria bacterium]|nr:MAG: MBL fold metallo-hydrolase [Alphaproteobacteria bacterium]